MSRKEYAKPPKVTVRKDKGVNGRLHINVENPPSEPVTMEMVKRNVEVTRKGQRTGNTAFIDRICWCVEMRLKLMGAFKDDEKGVTVNVINWDDMVVRKEDRPDPIRAEIEAVKPLPPARKGKS